MKKAFTMIELIFIIVIIGILSVIAISRLSATRDDARMVVDVNNIATCINDLSSSYTAQKRENIDTEACNNIKCAVIDIGNPNDGNITVTLKDSSSGKPKFCDYVREMAKRKKLDGKHSFGGKRIKIY